jgi:hypothetical protein
MNKDTQYLEEAYQTILEKSAEVCKYSEDNCDCNGCKDCKANQKESKEDSKEDSKELSPKQKKIAQAAPPPDEITGADFAALNKKKKATVEEAYEAILEKARKVEFGPSSISGPFEKSKKAFEIFKDNHGERIEDNVSYVVHMKDDVSDEVSKELLGKDVLALDPFDIIKIEKK